MHQNKEYCSGNYICWAETYYHLTGNLSLFDIKSLEEQPKLNQSTHEMTGVECKQTNILPRSIGGHRGQGPLYNAQQLVSCLQSSFKQTCSHEMKTNHDCQRNDCKSCENEEITSRLMITYKAIFRPS